MTTALGVIGAGYLGTTHAICMAELGYEVIAVDTDPIRVESLNAAELPFFEPELPELLRRHTANGRLRFTTSMAELAERADVHFICVGTPQQLDGMAADTSQVFAAVESLCPHLTRPTLLVGKSTVPVGTAARLAETARRLAPQAEVELAWNPEFLREGHAVADTLSPDRLVFGVTSAEAEKKLRLVYETPLDAGVPMIVTDLATAELVKTAANAFLATKISFVNAMAQLCDASGGDVVTLADALGLDARIGRSFLNAGLGFGGGCLPKDIRALAARADELGADGPGALLREVDAINTGQRLRVAELAIAECGGSVLGRRIAVLGAAFKPDTDDVRDSPALDVAGALQRQGAQVAVYDPRANVNAARLHPTLTYVDSVVSAVEGAHLVLHLTEWQEFADLDPISLAPLTPTRKILDARNTLNADLWRQAGWSFRSPGRPTPATA